MATAFSAGANYDVTGIKSAEGFDRVKKLAPGFTFRKGLIKGTTLTTGCKALPSAEENAAVLIVRAMIDHVAAIEETTPHVEAYCGLPLSAKRAKALTTAFENFKTKIPALANVRTPQFLEDEDCCAPMYMVVWSLGMPGAACPNKGQQDAQDAQVILRSPKMCCELKHALSSYDATHAQ